MYLRIMGFLGFVLGIIFTIPTVASDIYKIALYGEVEETALAFCFNAAYKVGFSHPNMMAILLWLAPAYLMIFSLFLFAGNKSRIRAQVRN